MDYFLIYMLFAATTGATACYELLYPVMRFRKTQVPEVEYEAATYATFFLVTILAAPYVILSCLIPSRGQRFRTTLHKALFEEPKIQS